MGRETGRCRDKCTAAHRRSNKPFDGGGRRKKRVFCGGERVLSSLEAASTFRPLNGLTGDSDNEMNERAAGVRCAVCGVQEGNQHVRTCVLAGP